MSTPLISLTDDEFVAVLHQVERTYALDLPTVDTSNPDDLRRAVGRGYRSMGVRGLFEQGGLSEKLRVLAEAFSSGSAPLIVYVGHEDFRQMTFLLMTLWWPLESSWLRQGVTPIGTHVFQAVTTNEMTETLVSAVDRIHATGAGVDDGDTQLHLCLTRGLGGNLTRAVAVACGSVQIATISEGTRESHRGSRSQADAWLREMILSTGR